MSAIFARGWKLALAPLSAMALAGALHAQSPDVIVYDIGVDSSNTNDIHYYGQNAGIAAYSFATQSCNKGTATLNWLTGGSTLHPVIGQNMFRLKNGRFEQIGQSWLKHGFCAVNETEAACGPCQSTPCDSLGVGCADTYWATLNDGQSGQSKINVNAAAGSHVHGGGPAGNATIRGRLQVAVDDMEPTLNAGALYFIEGQYVTQDDAQAGASSNNASWRKVNVNSVSSVTGGGNTNRQIAAMWAWQDSDPAVIVKTVQNLESGGAKTTFFLGAKVTDIGGGMWHYEYAIQNLNSDQSAGSFSVPVDATIPLTNVGFHDVSYHSGDPYDPTDWPGSHVGNAVSWACTPFASNPNANALRWGTLYNFRFDCPRPPENGQVTMGLFKTGPLSSLTIKDVPVPMHAITFDAKKNGKDYGGSIPNGTVGTPPF